MSQPLLVIFLGPAGAGKTYFARQLAEKMNAVHLNADAARLASYGSLKAIHEGDAYTPEANKRLSGTLDYATRAVLSAGKDVIYDTPRFNNGQDRTSIINMANSVNAHTVIVWMDIERDVASQRAQERDETEDTRKLSKEDTERILTQHYKQFDPPKEGEVVVKIPGNYPFERQYQLFIDFLKKA